MQMDPIIRSRRKALREACTWLLARAREMNDPQARDILNSAAFTFGQEKLLGFNRETGLADPQPLGGLTFPPAQALPGGPAQRIDTGK